MFESTLLAIALMGAPCTTPGIPDKFDRMIRVAVQKHWPVHAQVFVCWWKAQLWSESRLNPKAKSPVGAIGIGQVMRPTGKEQLALLGIECDLWEPRCNIEVATAYSGRIMRMFTSPRPVLDLICHEAIAYNAGPGSDFKAQVIGKSEECDKVLEVLHYVTGRHAKETRGYVARIRRTFIKLLRGK